MALRRSFTIVIITHRLNFHVLLHAMHGLEPSSLGRASHPIDLPLRGGGRVRLGCAHAPRTAPHLLSVCTHASVQPLLLAARCLARVLALTCAPSLSLPCGLLQEQQWRFTSVKIKSGLLPEFHFPVRLTCAWRWAWRWACDVRQTLVRLEGLCSVGTMRSNFEVFWRL